MSPLSNSWKKSQAWTDIDKDSQQFYIIYKYTLVIKKTIAIIINLILNEYNTPSFGINHSKMTM